MEMIPKVVQAVAGKDYSVYYDPLIERFTADSKRRRLFFTARSGFLS